jgi:hypothetical protein
LSSLLPVVVIERNQPTLAMHPVYTSTRSLSIINCAFTTSKELEDMTSILTRLERHFECVYEAIRDALELQKQLKTIM